MDPILAFRETPVDITALKYNLDLFFHLVPYLPSLVALERRTTVANRQTVHKWQYKETSDLYMTIKRNQSSIYEETSVLYIVI